MVQICPRICFCGESISKNAFRWFESVYRPEKPEMHLQNSEKLQSRKNEIVLRTMKSERSSDEIFGVPPQMKLNPSYLTPRSGISSRSDFIPRKWDLSRP